MISETSHQGQIQKILVEGDNFFGRKGEGVFKSACLTVRTKSYVLLGGLGDLVPQKPALILIQNVNKIALKF